MKERFLPIGSVVLLKGGKKEVMITSYCIFPTNIQIVDGKAVKPERKMYEYGGCIFSALPKEPFIYEGCRTA